MTSRRKRAERATVWAQTWSTCQNCGEKGRHFAPPGFGSPGMYVCQKPDQSPTSPDALTTEETKP